MKTPSNLKYAKSDEWFDPASGAVGISDYAQRRVRKSYRLMAET
jgi:glycine cleavage system H lipoate-binding protein